ncbi:MAG TPA: class I SAM-dependent methyltransferase [Thermoleophilaceae bacterium]
MEGSTARDAALLSEHLNESLRRLPGPVYYQVLRWIHLILKPVNYLEIGVDKGVSLEQAAKSTRAIGIDPAPTIEHTLSPAVTIYEMTSDDFFAQHDARDLLGGPVELAFIDGLHLFEQVLRDFVNLERASADDTVVILHDCLPLDDVTSARERTTDFYCGDVWKATLALRRHRPELDMVVVPTAPTGLCLVRNLHSARRFEEELPEIESEFRDRGFDYYLAHQEEMPPQIANDIEAVRDWLMPG